MSSLSEVMPNESVKSAKPSAADNKVPFCELQSRMERFRRAMDARNPGWELVAICGRINLYYLTGTMQEGLLLVPRGGDAVYWVRRSYERAVDESFFPQIRPMESYREPASALGTAAPATIYLEMDFVPMSLYQRLQKAFHFTNASAVDETLGMVRAIKSPYELALMEISGDIHRRILEERIPTMLKKGMSEAELGAQLFPLMIAEGYQGIVRFGMLNTEMVVGLIGFGENSIYPSSMNGPGGNYGLSPAVPLLGSRERKLKDGDLVFIDIASGVNGYHTDKTETYMFGRALPKEVIAEHNRCVEIQLEVAAQLKPGAIPSEIYKRTISNLKPEFLDNFMGFGNRRVKFLGHGVGLVVDELPVIAKGFDEPLQEGMVFAIEPKKGIPGIGMVGIEDTFLVTPQGGRSITGTNRGLIPVF